MSDGSLNLFQIGKRGVNVTASPVHLLPDEVRKSQNAEYSVDQGEGGIEQRPGMTKINAAPLASIVAIHDNPAQSIFDLTPYLYASYATAGTHKWARSLDGSLWEDVDVPVKAFSVNANVLMYTKQWPKCTTIGRSMYYFDASSPINLHQWDGTTDSIVATIPPSITGSVLVAPGAPVPTVASDDAALATTYTYKLVAKQGSANNSAASVAGTTAVGPAALSSGDFIAFQPGTIVVAPGITSFDVYRTAGGGSTGKIGTIPVSGGIPTLGNGSGLIGTSFSAPLAPGTTINHGWTPAGITYTYKLVKIVGAGHSAAGAGVTITTIGPTAWDAFSSVTITNTNGGQAGDTYDVYRTSGGPSVGKIGSIAYPAISINDTGQAGDGTTPPTTKSGLDHGSANIFTDGGIAGDASVAPSSATGTTAGPALGVVDVITDGTSLFAAVIDQNNSDPTVYGRILQFNPTSQTWVQIGPSFPTASGNGAADCLAFYDGALSYGTYIGITAGNAAYLTTTGQPLPAGGIIEVHATAVSQMPIALAVFNGVLYAAYLSFSAAAAIIAKRVAGATWSTARTGPATAAFNAYTSLGVFNGKLFAGWSSGDGLTAGRIESTVDGATWVNELTLAVTDVVCQMVEFKGALYVVLGLTNAGYNTTTKIIKRDIAGTWTTVYDPSDQLAGCIGVVYT